MSVQAPEQPSGSFGGYLQEDPNVGASAAGTAQKMQLFAKGAAIGWLGEDSGQWCIVTGQDAAVSLEPYVLKGVLYYRNAADTSRYLSVSDGYHYVGFYNWIGARGWTLNGDVLTSLYTNEQLSYWSTDNGYVYANTGSGYTPLTVQFH
ncbi:MAG: hypothetical protein ACRDJO_09175 [Actinomycetota bacterium]